MRHHIKFILILSTLCHPFAQGFALPLNVLLVDKKTNQLHVAEYGDREIKVLKTFHATLGKALGDKEVEKDLKTPEGFYFFTAKLTPPNIKKKFGAMALMMNYPNPVDEMAGKTGYDIMLHATDDPSRLKRNLDSEGCVVVDNPEIQEISKYVQLGVTPVLIYSELKPEYLQNTTQSEVAAAFQSWLNAWKSKDLDSYIGFYDDRFSYSGMSKSQYRAHKKSLNEKYAEIEVQAQDVKFFTHPKYSVVSFTQVYRSKLKSGQKGFASTGHKVLYLAKNGPQYKILSEGYNKVSGGR